MSRWTRLKPPVGAVLGGLYKLGHPIPGGMGQKGSHVVIYSARHLGLGTNVAVHVMSVPLDDAERAEITRHVLRDGRVASGLGHPNLLRVHDVRLEEAPDVSLYTVTDMPSGRSLREHIKRYGPFERPRALRLFIDVLEGLAVAHDSGLIHRNLKTSTLFLAQPGRLKERLLVTGFGLSHIEEKLIANLMASGQIQRLPRHAPPEYNPGGSVQAAADVYQMALVLIEMLSGQPVSPGQDVLDNIREKIKDATLSQALHLGELGTVLEKALAEDPADRFEDARVFAKELRSLQDRERANGDTEPRPAPTSGILGPGTMLADVYEIKEPIGRGGFAVVYNGRQHGIDRPVAIKVLTEVPRDGSWEEYSARFLREARAAAQIRHPNVVNIYHFGLVDHTRQPFMVMELLEGRDLEVELIERGPMDPLRAIPLVCEALDALGEAHRLGIVHKDLKPGNLFITEDRRGRELLKITDFGIARMGSTDERLTLNGRPVCTPSYAAPEYVMELVAGPALDVYQMGLVLVEMMTGKPVVDEDTVMKCIRAHLAGQLDVPEALLNGPLGPVLKKALAKDWKARYENADGFLDALRSINAIDVSL